MTFFFKINSGFTLLIFSSLTETLPMTKGRAVEVGCVLLGCLEVIPVSPFGAIALTVPVFIDPLTGCSREGRGGGGRQVLQ